MSDRVLRVSVEAQGHRFQARVQGAPHRGGGPRGKVAGFSRASRKRFLDRLTSLELGRDVTGLFVTLTYKDPIPSPVVCKLYLDRLGKKLRKEFPKLSGYWRFGLESDGVRTYNPHFHLLLFGLDFVPVEWLQEVWAEISDEQGGWVWIERVRGWRQAMAYVSKYMARPVEDRSLDYIAYLTGEKWTGRMWGVIARANLPFAAALCFSLAMGKWFYRVKRSGRRVWSGVNRSRFLGFTLYRDDAYQWARLVVFQAGL